MFVLFLHGPYAVGKHSVGSALSAKTGLPLFHNHLAVDPAMCLFEFGSQGFKRVREVIWLTSFSEAAACDRSFIFTFSPERTVDPNLIAEMHRSVVIQGGHVHYIELCCRRETLLSRLSSESRRRFNKLTDVEIYKRLEAEGSFDYPKLPDALLRIDTDQFSPAEAAEMIMKAIEQDTK